MIDLGGAFSKSRHAREAAESGAVLLGNRPENGSETENRAPYLGQWLESIKESLKAPLQLLREARQAADLIYPEPASAETM